MASASASASVEVEWGDELVMVTVTAAASSEPELVTIGQDSLLAALQESSAIAEVVPLTAVEEMPEEVVAETVAGKKLEMAETRGAQWVWLIGLGSLSLLVTGLIRRFSGR